MGSLGDFHSGCTIYDLFVTTDTSGRPAALAGNPPIVLVVYRNAFVDSCSTVGATLALNCNGLLGVNAWSVNTELDKGFYACASQYQVLLRGGCVNSICVSGYVVGRFSLAKTATLRPQVAGRNCVGVTASGKIEIDPCAAIFSVQKLLDRPVVDSCSTIFSVQSVLNAVTPTACSTIFSVKSVENAVYVSSGAGANQIDLCGGMIKIQHGANTGQVNLRDGRPGINWDDITNKTSAAALSCTTIFQTTRVDNAVTPTACSAIFSVQSVLNAVTPTACSTVYEVITISNSGVAKILDTAITQPTVVFAWASASMRNILGWLGALSSNCLRQTATVQTLRARDDLSAIATANLTCEATTVHRGSFT